MRYEKEIGLTCAVSRGWDRRRGATLVVLLIAYSRSWARSLRSSTCGGRRIHTGRIALILLISGNFGGRQTMSRTRLLRTWNKQINSKNVIRKPSERQREMERRIRKKNREYEPNNFDWRPAPTDDSTFSSPPRAPSAPVTAAVCESALPEVTKDKRLASAPLSLMDESKEGWDETSKQHRMIPLVQERRKDYNHHRKLSLVGCYLLSLNEGLSRERKHVDSSHWKNYSYQAVAVVDRPVTPGVRLTCQRKMKKRMRKRSWLLPGLQSLWDSFLPNNLHVEVTTCASW